MRRKQNHNPHSTPNRRPRGFTLAEVMFAVIILGIGFILIAGMFPVMISQSRMTVEETTAAGIARGAQAISNRIAEGSDAANANGVLIPTTDLLPKATAAAQEIPMATARDDANTNTPAQTIPAYGEVYSAGKILACDDPRINTLASNTPPGTSTIDYRYNLMNAFRGSIVPPSDNRFAWVPLIRRGCTYQNVTNGPANFPADIANPNVLKRIDAPFATVYFIPVAVRNRSLYNTGIVTGTSDIFPMYTGAGGQSNLSPRPVGVKIFPNSLATTGYTMTFNAIPANNPFSTAVIDNTATVAEGSFVIISDDRIAKPPEDHGIMNGRVFRVGNQRTDIGNNVWEVAPGSGLPKDNGSNGLAYSTTNTADTDDIVAIGNQPTGADDTQITAASGYPTAKFASADASAVTKAAGAFGLIVGRNATGTKGAYDGPTQDVGVFVTYVKVN